MCFGTRDKYRTLSSDYFILNADSESDSETASALFDFDLLPTLSSIQAVSLGGGHGCYLTAFLQ